MFDLFASAAYKDKWEEWKTYRVQEKRQKKYNEKGEERALKRLKRISGDDEQTAIAILDEAMELQYIGFFPLKTKQNGISKSDGQPASGAGGDKLTALGNW